ncbi:hypothetical protein [Scytonema millei]|uniref:Uncharacterized protein n=1 Tax=Tolypothrix bouteillei VB521301 TaxID=1479485 RepID=A0A8S9T410_9CYAN|nr:hypothetical protein DA73_0400012450 [Tolypothrix bouteillei VB521301]
MRKDRRSLVIGYWLKPLSIPNKYERTLQCGKFTMKSEAFSQQASNKS